MPRFESVDEKTEYISGKKKPDWDANCTYCESDFIEAIQEFFHLAIGDALSSDDYIIKILAILDRRTGKRVLARIKKDGAYLDYPEWARTFYELRFDADNVL